MKRSSTALLAIVFASYPAAADNRTVLESLSKPMAAIGTLRGHTPQGTWVGGAVAIAQNDCFVAVSTAGHNIRDGRGKPTSPLHTIDVKLKGHTLAAVETVMDQSNLSTHPPEDDWAIVIARKPTCGISFDVMAPKAMHRHLIPDEGLPVAMACYHHDRAELVNRLAAQECTLYSPGTQFGGLYARKSTEPVGLHSCTAKLGTSGCPLITKTQNQTYFIGTQIEAHYTTGAGVARLFSGKYQAAYNKAMSRMQYLARSEPQLTAN